MKHKGKKIFAMFLVLAMLFSMSSVSFADTTDEAISINFATIASNPNAEKIASNEDWQVYVYKISSSVPMTGDTKVKITGTDGYSVTGGSPLDSKSVDVDNPVSLGDYKTSAQEIQKVVKINSDGELDISEKLNPTAEYAAFFCYGEWYDCHFLLFEIVTIQTWRQLSPQLRTLKEFRHIIIQTIATSVQIPA